MKKTITTIVQRHPAKLPISSINKSKRKPKSLAPHPKIDRRMRTIMMPKLLTLLPYLILNCFSNNKVSVFAIKK